MWNYIYYGWKNAEFPRYFGEWIYDNHISRKDAEFEFENVCIASIHDTDIEHSVTFYSYTDQWIYSSDVINIEHVNREVTYFGEYTIKRQNKKLAVTKNFIGLAFLPSITCEDGFYHFLSRYIRFIWGALENTGWFRYSDLILPDPTESGG